MIVYVALTVAVLIPLLYLYFIEKLDKYETGKTRWHILTLLWGIIAYFIAAQINPAIIHLGWASRETVIRVIAPILEEVLKALLLIYIIQRADFNFIVDGVIYGFGAGIGFAIAENFEYVSGHPSIALSVALARVFSTNLIHATGTGIISGGLAYRRSDLSWRSWVFILGGYCISILFHISFNTIVSSGVALVVAFIFGGVGGAGIWYVIHRGLSVQKKWIENQLNVAVRASKEETKIASDIERINEILTPVRARFGEQKVSLVRSFIYKQGEIGIKRRLLESASSEAQKKEINAIIEGLVAETNVLRNQVGVYCMMLVRELYLGQEIQAWNLLNARVAAAGLGQKGGGLWNRVDAKLKDASKTKEET
ncbi:MAG: PrsW family intramembrane metalloprotease [Anaerolineales bacterium]|nr:PrsW family intramembrane metalloprotease [Anaerolineales bacterium]